MDCAHAGTLPHFRNSTRGQVNGSDRGVGYGAPAPTLDMDNDDARTDRVRAANRRVLIIVGLIALLLYLSQYFLKG